MDFSDTGLLLRRGHGTIPWSGVLLAFGVSQIVAYCHHPGGSCIVEGSWPSFSSPTEPRRFPHCRRPVYRLLTFWLVIVVGWISIGVIEWRVRHGATLNPWRCPRRGPVWDGSPRAWHFP